MKKIAIIGDGYVGNAMFLFFSKHYSVIVKGEADYDISFNENAKNDETVQSPVNKNEINKCDFAVICVPTPMGDDGIVDTSIVEETLQWIDVPLILIKSTVPPMFTLKQGVIHHNKNIVFSPEYLGEGKYVVPWWKDKGYPHPTDIKYHDFQIFGGSKDDTRACIQFFQKVLGPETKYIQTDSTTAELTKYIENAWGAMKVTFCHEFHEIAKALDVDYSELRELWLLDGRVERMHTAVFEDDKGFAGKCFPKDVRGIYEVAKAHGVDAKILKAILDKNDDLHS